MDSGAAYEHFRTRSLMAGGTVDVYLADIASLGHLVDPELSEKFLKHAFVAGLPTGVKDKIKTSDHLSKLSLGETVARARVFVSDIQTHAAVAGLRRHNSSRTTSQQWSSGHPQPSVRRFQDKKPPLSPEVQEAIRLNPGLLVCFRCAKVGHYSRQCPRNTQENC